ncbi:hypothetical protein [Limosilactobacillus reuteri]|uniref:hypothetical protein n=1 Tax=Limosilactobacillus reuteri TaxID=1598 RepID=UPI00081C2A33|nr:hypothetical protein [Limosilactobacillus reuteri]OCW61414.1 hypothetical protein BBP12_09975 [Limosilactobacillus reuteri]OCW63948.1 hypothetical protein BBP10_05650 [Limosilactobacillus reuteri]OCW66986.1 hypothetical protein BBP11_03120 [Limosilactobacillus reuteri]OCW70249.1 hypothetical protein BBP13_00145 [Limosilactobacillus reuteri]
MSLIKDKAHLLAENYNSIGDYKNLYKIASKYKYITFDIFDTLIKRDVSAPTDIFKIIERKYNVSGFYAKRINAEKIARLSSKKREININDIYEKLDYSSKIMSLEKEVEINECNVNKDLIDFYNWAVENKDVYLITDMYLDRKTISSILMKSQIKKFKKLIISNEENSIKSDSSLFKKFLKDNSIRPEEVLHIGNSLKADYLGAKRVGIRSIKLPTYKQRTAHNYISKKALSTPKSYLNAFINNHTSNNDPYFQFGYECFGPLLYGFVKEISKDMEENDINKVLFMSRDGYIIKKLYDSLKLNKKIPSFYFEASRRSLRVPNYSPNMSYGEMVDVLTVPNLTNLSQIFDSWGLDINNYNELLRKIGLRKQDSFKRADLKTNKKFLELFEYIKNDIFENSKEEMISLKKYLNEIDFSKKVAIVDIGWGGSMQKFLNETLKKMGIDSDITGYYIGLTQKSRENLGNNNLKAKGYAFDRLHNSGKDLERPFVGLFETLFLEQDGSVKRYQLKNNAVKVERYPYEYLVKGAPSKEMIAVKKIQSGALSFAEDFNKSLTSKVWSFSNEVMFSNLHQVGVSPTLSDTRLFGNFDFFNNGTKVKLAAPHTFFYYLFNIKTLRQDLYDCQWKIGFLKRLFKIPLNYVRLFEYLHRAAN